MEKHPGMKTVVANEIERLLFRPNVPQSAQYDNKSLIFLPRFFSNLSYYRHYGLCCLTTIVFTDQDNDLANKMIKIYFALFRVKLIRFLYFSPEGIFYVILVV